MSQTIEISVPDPVLKAFGADERDLPQRSIEAIVAHLYQTGRMSHAQVGTALGLNRCETDGFLKAANAFRKGYSEELEKDFATIRKFL